MNTVVMSVLLLGAATKDSMRGQRSLGLILVVRSVGTLGDCRRRLERNQFLRRDDHCGRPREHIIRRVDDVYPRRGDCNTTARRPLANAELGGYGLPSAEITAAIRA
jgi:hypothetical protein